MKLVFVAGPYRASSEFEARNNVRRAEEVALAVWRAGAACICPHKNTDGFGGAAEDKRWLDGALEMVRRSDAIVCVKGWERSVGAKGEVDLARKLGIPVLTSIEEFTKWLAESHVQEEA